MKGFNVAEQGHVVNLIPPVDITGGKSSDIFSMQKHHHASIIIQIGVSAAAFTSIVVNECTALDGTGRTAIPFSVYKEETAAGDTLGARTAVTTAGVTPHANNNIMYVIELDASELTDGSHFVEVVLANGTNSVIASAVAILSGARYAEVESPTAIA